MSWDETESGMVRDHLAIFGVTIILPGGVPVLGEFRARGGPQLMMGELTGMDARLEQEPQPVLYLAASDGAALVEGDPITAPGGAEYVVSRSDPDGQYWLRVELGTAPSD